MGGDLTRDEGRGGGRLWAWRLFSDCHGFPTFDDI